MKIEKEIRRTQSNKFQHLFNGLKINSFDPKGIMCIYTIHILMYPAIMCKYL